MEKDDKAADAGGDAPRETKPQPKLGGGALIATIGAPALLLLVVAALATKQKKTPSSADADAGAPLSPNHVVIADLPAPRCNDAATSEVREAREALRSTGADDAVMHLRAAIRADADCAEAHLRIALLFPATTQEEATQAFGRARALRDRLSDRDKDLVTAFEPTFAAPPNETETRKRLAMLASSARGNDAELLALAAMRPLVDEPLNAIAFGKKATKMDPKFALGWRAYAFAAARAGEIQTADEALEKCIVGAPKAIDCLHDRVMLHRRMGLCDAMEKQSREALTVAPPPAWARPMLANALATKHAAREALTEVLGPRWSDPSLAKDWIVPYERARVAILYGAFADARTELDALAKQIEGSNDIVPHAAYTLAELDLLEETESAEAASRFAAEQAKKLASWTRGAAPPPPYVRWLEPRLASVLPAQAREPLLTAWKTTLKGSDLDETARWAYGDALLVTKREEAGESTTRMPKRSTKAPASAFDDVDYWSGRAQLAAKRTPLAVVYLQEAASRCDAFDRPFEHVRVEEQLGLTYEDLSDVDRACASYRFVVERWGKSKPESVTAKRARDRIRELKCADKEKARDK